MNCPRCQAENDSGARFCEDCGARLEAACPSCGTPVTPGKKFCRSCGAALTTEPAGRFANPDSYTPKHLAEKILTLKSALEGERKVVTVLFCDIANSTPLAERLGAEAMHALLNRFFELALAEVHRYEGTINQFLGDGFMALFGAPIAHEDHARRAVLAALGIQRTLREWCADGVGGAAAGLAVRMGLNTGSVVVGKIGDNLRMDYTAVGDTTNLAARLQQHAEPGMILMSEATHRLVRGYVRVDSLPPTHVKGKVEPIATFTILGLGQRRSPLEGRDDRALSQFVGRQREIRVLRDLLADVEAGRGQVVGILGEPGSGKSRLLYEFRQSLGNRQVTYLEGRCLSYGSPIPYLPLQDIIRSNCRVTEADTAAEIGEKVRTALVEVGMRADDRAPYLLQLLGVKEGTERLAQIGPETIKSRIFEAVRQMSLHGSHRRPLIVSVEDLHWTDKTSEEYLASMVESLAGARILLLATYRPGYRPPWTDKSYATQIALRPLSVEDSLTVVQSAVQRADLSARVTRDIVHKAEGNPFFLEELSRSVLERGDAAIPDTIQGVLMARIDRLPDEPKAVLQTASVLGRQFTARLLSEVAREHGLLSPLLIQLIRLEFLYERLDAGEARYVFKHALTQEVAYESLLTNRRQALHEATGRALETLYADRLEEQYELLAHHYSRGGNPAKALEYLELAGQKAVRANAVDAAKAYFNQTVVTLDAMADTPMNRRRRAASLVNHLPTVLLTLDAREYFRLLQDATPLVEGLRDRELLAAFYTRLGWCTWWFGLLDEAVTYLARATQLQERTTDAMEVEITGTTLIWNYTYKGDFRRAVAATERMLAAHDEHPRPRWYVMGLSGGAWAYAYVGHFAEAAALAQRAKHVGEAVSDDSLVSFAAWVLALI